MKTRTTTALVLAATLLLLSVSLEGTEQEIRVAYSGQAQFAGADVPADAPALVAWRSSDQGWSKLQLLVDGEKRSEWSFSDLLVKKVRWIDSGTRFLIGSIGTDGPVDHLYRLQEDGEIVLEWTTSAMERDGQAIGYSADGQFWLADQLSVGEAIVKMGRVGSHEMLWHWHLDAREYGEASPLAADQYSYSFFLADSGSPPRIGILWGARLWLASPSSQQLVSVAPPEGCDEIHGAFSTEQGLWIDCYRGLDAKPSSSSWAYYPGGTDADVAVLRPTLVEQFRAPRFLTNGTIVDTHSRAGIMVVYEVAGGGYELKHVGDLDVPSNARVLDAGDSLLIEVGDLTDEFRVLPLKQEITRLKEDAARANK